MKKVLLSFGILWSSLTYSQSLKAEIHYKDGSVKKGLLRNIEKMRHSSSIDYKASEDAKKEIIYLDNVQKIVYINDNGKNTVAERIEFKKKRNFWGIIYKEVENLKVYRNIFTVKPKFDRGMLLPGFTQIEYFAVYKDAPAMLIFMDTNGIGLKATNKKTIKKFFKDKCPKLVENINEIEYKEHYPDPYIEYFEKHCK